MIGEVADCCVHWNDTAAHPDAFFKQQATWGRSPDDAHKTLNAKQDALLGAGSEAILTSKYK